MEHTFSYWEKTAFIDNADVIIIGSGLVGLSAAVHLKTERPSLKILVLERGFLPTGASTKNAGFACFGTASEQLAYLRNTTPDEVLKLVDYKWRGLKKLRENLGDENIEYQQHGGYELFFDNEAERAENSLNSLEILNSWLEPVTDGQPVYSIADDKIADFGFSKVRHMIYNPFEGQINTGKMMRALLNKAYELGILVLNGCEILKIGQEKNKIRLLTSQGDFEARNIILATNAFANQLLPELNVIPGRGQVLITKPIPGLKLKGTFHLDEGYYYFRNIDNRILFGGGRNLDFAAEKTWDFGQTEVVKNKLTSYLREVILPDQPVEIDYWWSGIMGFGDENKPIVKKVAPGIFCAVRCNGMGVAMGSLVGEEVAELLISEL